MRSRSQCRIGMAQPLFAAFLPMALLVPASAQPVPGLPFGNGGSGYHTVSPGRTAAGNADGDGGAETPWQRRPPPYETRGGGPGYRGRPNWLPGATGVLGVLPMLGGGSAWPSGEQVPARSESAPGYQASPASAPPQIQQGPEPSAEPAVTAPEGSAGSSTRPPTRTSRPPYSHPPSGHRPSGKVAGGGHPMIYPPRKPPVPTPQQIEPPGNPQPAAPVAAAVATVTDAPPASPSAAAPPPPEPPAPANTAPATPPSPAPAPPTQAAAPQPPAKPVWSVSQIGLPLSALVALALLAVPLRLLTMATRRRSRRRVARIVFVRDPGASRMIPEQAGPGYPAITLRLSAAPLVATPRWTAA
jgi:hypothetical protein